MVTTEQRVLDCIAQHGPISARQVSEILSLSFTTASTAALRLFEQKCATRVQLPNKEYMYQATGKAYVKPPPPPQVKVTHVFSGQRSTLDRCGTALDVAFAYLDGVKIDATCAERWRKRLAEAVARASIRVDTVYVNEPDNRRQLGLCATMENRK